jgi:hypothetical protein
VFRTLTLPGFARLSLSHRERVTTAW